jgi:hypothetical protein
MPGNVLTKIYIDLLQEEALKICRRAGFYDEKSTTIVSIQIDGFGRERKRPEVGLHRMFN